MGRTLPSITQIFNQEEDSLKKYRYALRRADQLMLDELFTAAHKHLSAAAYAAHLMPMEIFLLSMLLEEHKEVRRLRDQLQALREQVERIKPEEEEEQAA